MNTIYLRSLKALLLTFELDSNVAVSNECPAVPPAVQDIVSANIYGDGGLLSGINQHGLAERERLVKPILDFVQPTAIMASEAFENGSETAARCAIGNLRIWAEANALLGIVSNEAANKELIWNTAGLTLAYLRVKHYASPEAAKVIEAWIRNWPSALLSGTAAQLVMTMCFVGLVWLQLLRPLQLGTGCFGDVRLTLMI
jgi:hypothetical protein